MQQNHAVMFLAWMNRLVRSGKAVVREDNPLVFQLDAVASGYFLLGRNMKNKPFLGVPVQFMPFFTQIDWMEASICREEGLFLLEARDPVSQSLFMALSFSFRRERLNVFCLENEENIAEMPLSIKVFKQNPKNPDDLAVSDHDELIGIPQKEVYSIMDIGTDLEIDNARRLFENTGVGSAFTAMSF